MLFEVCFEIGFCMLFGVCINGWLESVSYSVVYSVMFVCVSSVVVLNKGRFMIFE